jgi:hypothetical protein
MIYIYEIYYVKDIFVNKYTLAMLLKQSQKYFHGLLVYF